MAYVLDTNVYVSAALGDGPARRLTLVLALRGELVTSRFILDELLGVFQASPELAEKVPPSVAARYAAFLERHAALVEPVDVDWPDEPADAVIVGTALAADAPLVTGDKTVLEEAARFDVEAVGVRKALDEVVK